MKRQFITALIIVQCLFLNFLNAQLTFRLTPDTAGTIIGGISSGTRPPCYPQWPIDGATGRSCYSRFSEEGKVISSATYIIRAKPGFKISDAYGSTACDCYCNPGRISDDSTEFVANIETRMQYYYFFTRVTQDYPCPGRIVVNFVPRAAFRVEIANKRQDKTKSMGIFDLYDVPTNFANVKIATDESESTVFKIQSDSILSNMILRLPSTGNTVNAFGVLTLKTRKEKELEYTYKHPWVFNPTNNLLAFELFDQNTGRVVRKFTMLKTLPPVLLLHGLWSNGSAMEELKTHLVSSGAYIAKQIENPNYKNTAKFKDNIPAVQNAINQLLNNAVNAKISSGKVDIVGHSMGGLLSRMYYQGSSYQKDVNKLITLNTPHAGSQMANIIFTGFNTPYGRVSFATLAGIIVTFNGTNGAVEDLRVDSPLIRDTLNNSSNRAKGDVFNHAIYTDYNLPNFDPANFIIKRNISPITLATWLIYRNTCGFNGINDCFKNRIFAGENNDLIVAVSSQQGGLTVATRDGFSGVTHMAVESNATVLPIVLDLLKADPKSAKFVKNGFNPPTLNPPAIREEPVALSRSVPSLKIQWPVAGRQIRSNDTLNVVVKGNSDIKGIVMASGNTDSLWADEAAGSQAVFNYRVHKNAIGELVINAWGFDSIGRIIKDSVLLGVTTPTTLVLDSISLREFRLSLLKDQSRPFSVYAYYNDGTSRNITSLLTAANTKAEKLRFRLEGSSLLRGISVGLDTFRVMYGGDTIRIPVIVDSLPANLLINTPPSVNITSPTNNATFTAPASVTINANATDADGSIAKVEFYNGTTLLNTDNAAPYSFAWTNVAVGNYTLTAKAYDNLNAVTTSTTITIVVNAAPNTPPSVNLTSPTNNATFTTPASITINANATDADGSIAKVEFYNGTTLLNTDNAAPYSYNWTNVAVGNYTLTAKAYDNLNAVTTSTSVTIYVTNGGVPVCLQEAYLELQKLYNATNGANWTNKTNWFSSPNMATWYGITLTTDSCAIKNISLPTNNLTGTLPALTLSQLEVFNVSDNKITGTIPPLSMPKLTQLHLHLNQLTGTIPNFNLPNLTQLFLYNNQLTGTIPNFNLPNLVSLWLSFNDLTGNVPDFNLPNLADLRIRYCGLSGNVPAFSNTQLNAVGNVIWLTGNKFVFGDLVNKPWLSISQLVYAPQQNIKLNRTGNTISINTGVADNVQTFEWSKDGVALTTNQSSTYQPTVSGKYTCRVKHNTLTNAANADRNLILQTDTLNVIISGITEGVLNLDYFHVFPNPSSHIVNINAQFKKVEAIDLTISNALGQVIVNRKFKSVQVKETLDVSAFAEGTYQIILKTADGRIARTMTVIK